MPNEAPRRCTGQVIRERRLRARGSNQSPMPHSAARSKRRGGHLSLEAPRRLILRIAGPPAFDFRYLRGTAASWLCAPSSCDRGLLRRRLFRGAFFSSFSRLLCRGSRLLSNGFLGRLLLCGCRGLLPTDCLREPSFAAALRPAFLAGACAPSSRDRLAAGFFARLLGTVRCRARLLGGLLRCCLRLLVVLPAGLITARSVPHRCLAPLSAGNGASQWSDRQCSPASNPL